MRFVGPVIALVLGLLVSCSSNEATPASVPDATISSGSDTGTDTDTVSETSEAAHTTVSSSVSATAPDATAPDATAPDATALGVTLDDGRPATFWAITTDTYDLVQMDTATGEVLQSLGGWGSPLGECGEDDAECLFQAIDYVDVGPDGRVWLADCCEPAVGNVFVVDPLARFDHVDDFVAFGSSPRISPDGSILASGGLGQLLISEPDGELLSAYPEDRPVDGAGPWYEPIAWLDETTVVVRAVGDLVDTVVLFDVSQPTAPVQTGTLMGGLISHPSAAVRSDGAIFALSASFRGESETAVRWGVVFDPGDASIVAEVDLPDGTWQIDYDRTGTYLITSGDDGVVRWFGAGATGELGVGFVSASWE